jgi:predicted CoA-substrate-specific enzyme activase
MTYKEEYLIGMDVGSTTTKIVVLQKSDEKIIYSEYARHHAELAKSVCTLLEHGKKSIPEGGAVRIAFTGSGSKPLADAAGVPFVQEVVANSLAVMKYYPAAKTAIELGGQDAKVIFFRKNKGTGRLEVSDMRMNGSCAGGTGAFIDEIAALLQVRPEEYESLAERGTQVYDISGRCGVYAKTDIQPLLNQGVRKEDIALSALHAISKQTIGGLAQGLTMAPPIIFEGGPLCFHPTLVQAFREKLELEDKEILIPEQPELMVALGAALYSGTPAAVRAGETDPDAGRDPVPSFVGGGGRSVSAAHGAGDRQSRACGRVFAGAAGGDRPSRHPAHGGPVGGIVAAGAGGVAAGAAGGGGGRARSG